MALACWLLSQKGKAVFTIAGKGYDLASIVMLVEEGSFLFINLFAQIHHKLEGEDPNAQNTWQSGESVLARSPGANCRNRRGIFI